MKRTIYIFLAAAIMFASACESGIMPEEEFCEGLVCFRPVVNGIGITVETKSSELVSADGSISIPLSCEVSEGIVESNLPQTKGTLMNTVDGNDAPLGNYGLSSFMVKAWDGTNAFIAPFENVQKDSQSGLWNPTGTYPWSVGTSLRFYAYANLPESGATIYNINNSSIQLYCDGLPTSASEQRDILIGCYDGTPGYDATLRKGGIADIKFFHPLTAVRFKMGVFEIGGTPVAPENVVIKSISINGVYLRGMATMTPATADVSIDPGQRFSWLALAGATTVTLGNGDSPLAVGTDGCIGEPFLLIPQDLDTQPVTITVKLTLNGTPYVLNNKEVLTSKWESGKTNTYTLGYTEHTYSYLFTLSDDKTEGSASFQNTIGETSFTFENLVNKRVRDDSMTTDGEWYIESVKAGSEAVVTVNDDSFEGIGGLSATKDGDNLTITAARRYNIGGTNDYWTNATGRTDNLDWSPVTWANNRATASSPLDLSKLNFRTEETMPMTTANCYVIRHAGTYMLPLVYGNAVTGGVEYSQSYAPTTFGTAPEGTTYLTSFQNHLGKGITSAFIENNEDEAGTGYIEALTPYVVWQDKDVVVKGLEIIDNPSGSGTPGSYDAGNVRYLKFSISQDDICQNNAIIAVKDAEGRIIWSWHIWTTNDPALISAPISVTNLTNNEYKFFPLYALGWLDAEKYPGREDVTVVLKQKVSGNTITLTVHQPDVAAPASGCYYENGRKDPMCTTDGTLAEGEFTQFNCYPDENRVSLATTIQNPGVYYYRTSTPGSTGGVADGKYLTEIYTNLWTGRFIKSNERSEQNEYLIKTVYDPSPAGYKIPASNAFTGFTSDGDNLNPINSENEYKKNVIGDFNNGWHFYTCKADDVTASTPTIFFPSVGLRNYYTGKLGSADGGAYWVAGVYVKDGKISGYSMSNSSTKITPKNTHTAPYGFHVRPAIDATLPGNPLQ